MSGDRVYLYHPAFCVTHIFSETRTEDDCADKCRNTADHVNKRRSGVIDISEPRQPAAAPEPVCLYRIYDKRDYSGINAVCGEFCPLCHCSRNYCCRGRAEYEVEDEGAPVICGEVRNVAVIRNSDQPEQGVLSEKKPRTERHEYDRAYTEVHQVFHDDVPRVFRPGEACLHHCKAALHEKYKYRADKEPKCCRVHKVTLFQ